MAEEGQELRESTSLKAEKTTGNTPKMILSSKKMLPLIITLIEKTVTLIGDRFSPKILPLKNITRYSLICEV